MNGYQEKSFLTKMKEENEVGEGGGGEKENGVQEEKEKREGAEEEISSFSLCLTSHWA